MAESIANNPPADVGPATAAMLPNLSPEAALQEIAALKAGADREFLEAYINGNHISHKAAAARMHRLHELAYPNPADAAAPASVAGRDADGRFSSEAPIDVAEYKDLRLQFPEGVDIKQAAAANQAAREAASMLRIPPHEARGHVTMIEESIARRGGKVMDDGELDTMDAHLQRVAGPAYGEVVAGFRDAIANAGDHGPWLRNAILAADPNVAAVAILKLGRKRA